MKEDDREELKLKLEELIILLEDEYYLSREGSADKLYEIFVLCYKLRKQIEEQQNGN